MIEARKASQGPTTSTTPAPKTARRPAAARIAAAPGTGGAPGRSAGDRQRGERQPEQDQHVETKLIAQDADDRAQRAEPGEGADGAQPPVVGAAGARAAGAGGGHDRLQQHEHGGADEVEAEVLLDVDGEAEERARAAEPGGAPAAQPGGQRGEAGQAQDEAVPAGVGHAEVDAAVGHEHEYGGERGGRAPGNRPGQPVEQGQEQNLERHEPEAQREHVDAADLQQQGVPVVDGRGVVQEEVDKGLPAGQDEARGHEGQAVVVGAEVEGRGGQVEDDAQQGQHGGQHGVGPAPGADRGRRGRGRPGLRRRGGPGRRCRDRRARISHTRAILANRRGKGKRRRGWRRPGRYAPRPDVAVNTAGPFRV